MLHDDPADLPKFGNLFLSSSHGMKRRVNGSAKPSVSAATQHRKRFEGPIARLNPGKMHDARQGSSSNSETDSNSDHHEDSNQSSDSESDEPDVDEARIAQWEGEEEEEEDISSLERNVDNGEGPAKPTGKMSEASLSSFSYGSLLKARQALQQARVNSDSDYSESEDGAADLEETANVGTQGYDQEGSKPNKPGKRAHKHAPVEMSSKRQVTRRRQVVEVKKLNSRDPRFSPLAGTENPVILQKHYSFLADMHSQEYETMKENLKRARNMLRSSPRDQREAREEELERLERAFKRAESLVNRDKKEGIESQALEQVRKQEKERRKEGKSNWYLKKSEKKELLLKARHDALAETGGRFAVRKAIEKRQKKISQKEKKQRPSFTGRPGIREDADGRKSNKRQRITS